MGFIADVSAEFSKLELTKKALRNFGFTMAVVLAGIGVLIFFKSASGREIWFWGVAGFFLVFGLTAPAVLRPLYQVWMGIAFVLGWFVSRLLLSVIYYLVMSPIAFIVRKTSDDLLQLKIDKSSTSYWNRREEQVPREQYERMF